MASVQGGEGHRCAHRPGHFLSIRFGLVWFGEEAKQQRLWRRPARGSISLRRGRLTVQGGAGHRRAHRPGHGVGSWQSPEARQPPCGGQLVHQLVSRGCNIRASICSYPPPTSISVRLCWCPRTCQSELAGVLLVLSGGLAARWPPRPGFDGFTVKVSREKN